MSDHAGVARARGRLGIFLHPFSYVPNHARYSRDSDLPSAQPLCSSFSPFQYAAPYRSNSQSHRLRPPRLLALQDGAHVAAKIVRVVGDRLLHSKPNGARTMLIAPGNKLSRILAGNRFLIVLFP